MDDEALNLVFPKYVCRRSFFLAPPALASHAGVFRAARLSSMKNELP